VYEDSSCPSSIEAERESAKMESNLKTKAHPVQKHLETREMEIKPSCAMRQSGELKRGVCLANPLRIRTGFRIIIVCAVPDLN
jgi:hypothetical protein